MAGVDKESGPQDNNAQKSDLAEQITVDDLSTEGIVDVDESSVAAGIEPAIARRRLENYLEDRRLRKELDDDIFQ